MLACTAASKGKILLVMAMSYAATNTDALLQPFRNQAESTAGAQRQPWENVRVEHHTELVQPDSQSQAEKQRLFFKRRDESLLELLSSCSHGQV